jgi:hypothetical protein
LSSTLVSAVWRGRGGSGGNEIASKGWAKGLDCPLPAAAVKGGGRSAAVGSCGEVAVNRGTTQKDATLLDILIDGFEKNEVLGGFHWRELPLPDEADAVAKFGALVQEARRWKGPPSELKEGKARRFASWPDLEIRQAGRGVVVRVRPPRFDWWHEQDTWQDDPMAGIHDWISEEPA